MTLFTSQYCIYVSVVCADHNSFDLPVLDALYIGYFLLCYDIGVCCYQIIFYLLYYVVNGFVCQFELQLHM
jgi:hypothetical protein